jgi:protein translocase SecG subunit
MQTLVLVLHVLAAGGIIVLVLLQHGKGADMGAAFGSGSAGSLFGSRRGQRPGGVFFAPASAPRFSTPS